MKKIAFFLIFIYHINFAQNPTWLWAKSAIGSFNNFPQQTIIDSNGNTYVLGNFSPDINFDSLSLNGYINAKYLCKLNSNGNFVWVKKIECATNYEINTLILDINQNILLSGNVGQSNSFSSIIYNDETAINFEPTPNLGLYRSFSTLINSETGSIIWSDTDYGKSKIYNGVFDNLNNYYFFGEFNTSLDIDGTILDSSTASGRDMYISKKNNNNLVWAKKLNFYTSLFTPKIKYLQNNQIEIVAITTSDTFNFENQSYLIGNEGSRKIIVLKIDLDGNLVDFDFFDAFLELSNDLYTKFEIGDNGDIFLFGSFSDDTLTIGTTTLNKIGLEDLYISKINSNGQFLWANNLGIINKGLIMDCFENSDNKILVGTDFYPSGSLTINGNTYQCNGNTTSLIIEFDEFLNINWTQSATGIGTTGLNYPVSAKYNVNNEVNIIGGYTCQNILFTNFNLLNTDDTSTTTKTFFAKLSNTNLTNTSFDYKSFNIYPNPANDFINLNNDGINVVSIYDFTGKLIYYETNNNIDKLDVRKLSKGIYILKINNKYSFKFIKS